MRNDFKRREWRSLAIAFGAIAWIPCSVWLLRPRLLAAQSAAALLTLAREARQDEILEQMTRRYQSASLNFDAPEAAPDIETRWQEIQISLQKTGLDTNQTQRLVAAARSHWQDDWPIFAERAFLRGQPVWLAAGSSPTPTTMYWIERPTAQEAKREKIRHYCSRTQIVVLSPQPPYSVLN